MKSQQRVVLVFVRHYLPGYRSGGPVRTISNMVDHLGDELRFRIVTLDRDAGTDLPYPSVTPNEWTQVGKAEVFYASPRYMTPRGVAKLLRRTAHDVVYLNSFFDTRFTFWPLLCQRILLGRQRKTVIATRGEFSPGALRIKRAKKRLYLWLLPRLGFYSGLVWQASSESEARDIRRELPRIARDVVVAPNLGPRDIDVPSTGAAFLRDHQRGLRVVYISRITPKKNLHFALQTLANVTVTVFFSIFGPIRDQRYWSHCRRIIESLPANITVDYRGELLPECVGTEFSRHDLFFFPTLGENFGHVILESLRAGTPVLLSDQTPWQGDGSACQSFPLEDIASFEAEIERLAGLNSDEWDTLRHKARAYAVRVAKDPSIVEANRELFIS